MIDIEHFKLRLSAARAQAGFSVVEVAAYLGLKRQTVGQWEMGEIAVKAEYAQKLSKLYGIPMEWIDWNKEGNKKRSKEERAMIISRLLEPDEVVIPDDYLGAREPTDNLSGEGDLL